MKKRMKSGMVTIIIVAMLMLQMSASVMAEETNVAPLVFEGNCSYQTHIQNVGWQDWKSKESLSGTTGKSLRLEGIKIKLSDSANLGVSYQTHVQNIGWQDWVTDGDVSGTEGKSLRLEAIRMKLTGSEADKYEIYYQVHVQNVGWMNWVKNGDVSGTEGKALRLEGIKIVILPKGSPAPVNAGSIKNVIFMISDGCGSNQILATDYFTDGKAGTQVYEQFPTKLNMSTYSHIELGTADDLLGLYDPETIWSSFDLMKNYPTDSSAAATAMATGTKTYNAAIGVDQAEQDLVNIREDFEAQNKATGVITSVEFSHATPASFVAHNSSRQNYSEIAYEMLTDSDTDVIMGAGNPLYDDNGKLRTVVEDSNYDYVGGKDTWDNLVAGNLGNDADGDGDRDNWNLIQTKTEFEALQTGNTPERVIGVPQVFQTLQLDRAGDGNVAPFTVAMNENVPTLDVMAKSALNVLDNDNDGFFLMIEGGAIDWASHGKLSGRLIEEETDFNHSVEAVCNWVEANSNWDETLVIVTGDHETGYLTGATGVYGEVTNNGKGVMPTMAWNSTNHTNQLVPFFAKGPGAELFDNYANGSDPFKGAYLDNTEISLVIRDLLN